MSFPGPDPHAEWRAGAQPEPAVYDRGGFPDRRGTIMGIAGLVTSALVAVLSVVPSPYAIGAPGPTFDTLGEAGDMPLVQIEGAPTYEPSGELRLTTVGVSRGGSRTFTLGRVMTGWISPAQYVTPEEQVFGEPEDEEQFDEQAQQQWISSQESATVSALETLDVDVAAELYIAGVDEFSNATGLIEQGDRIVALNGEPVESFSALADELEGVTPGAEVTLTIERDGEQRDVTFATIESEDGRALMGVWIDPQFDLPIDVTVAIDTVGGPSAGLMFSLAIVDLLTEEDELDGARVAGTGAITADGDVIPIGGIVMKMHGARDAGSDYFLAPIENCAEVVGHIPGGLHVVSVDTLDDAYDAIVSIGDGRADQLPTC